MVAGNEAGAIRRLETPFGRAETLQAYNHYLGDPDRITWDLDRYRRPRPRSGSARPSRSTCQPTTSSP